MTAQFPELGCYLLAGQPRSARDIVAEVSDAESLGLGTAFISERYNKKEAAVLCGAARCFDDVILHTYFTDDTTRRCVGIVKSAATAAGRDPADVRIWSCLATVGDHLPYLDHLRKTVGRLGTYLQGYGALLVDTNGWDRVVLQRFLADPVVSSVAGLDVVGTTGQLEHAATLIPAEWLAASATGSPAECVHAVRRQFGLGCDGVILHGSTPAELAPIVAAYAQAQAVGTEQL